MKKIVVIILILVLASTAKQSFGQNKKTDSLQKALISAKEDTSKINILISLGWEIRESEPNKAVEYNNQALEWITRLVAKKNADYMIEWLQLAMSSVYNNFGVLNNVISSDPKKALEYHFKALSIRERLSKSKNKWIAFKSKRALGDTYKNMGSVYNGIDADTSKMYLNKALPLLKETGDRRGVSLVYTNLGGICQSEGKYRKSLEYFNTALQIGVEINNKRTIAIANLEIGDTYTAIGDSSKNSNDANYNKALEYYFEGLKVAKEDDNKKWIWNAYTAIETLYLTQKKYVLAKEYGLKSLELAKQIHFITDIGNSYLNLSQVYADENNFKDAYSNYLKYSKINDSSSATKLNQVITDVQNKYNNEKQQVEIELQNKIKEAELKAESRKQKLIIASVGLGLFLVIVFAGFIFRSLRVTNKQKNIIEQKNREITDSISYALRIQTAILPPTRIVKQYLENSFILYKPKDIVAGDFYWMETVGITDSKLQIANPSTQSEISNPKSEIILFAACDCTGHGVPGAMVSVVCHNALNRAVREYGLTQPAAILDKTAEIVIENFSKSEESIKDGMDISLCSLTPTFSKGEGARTYTLQWAGANNPLWIVRNTPSSLDTRPSSLLEETKADKQPIGMNEDSKPFTNHSFILNSGDTIYLFTDGFADQFGGETGEKKLTRKRFKDLLLSIQHLSMPEQGIALDKFIVEYRKEVEQIDDILVMGVRV